MDRTIIMSQYMSSYNDLVDRYKKEKIVNLVDDINTAIANSDVNNINRLYDEISEWNNSVSNLQGVRDGLMTHDKSLKLPSIIEFLIVLDHVNKEWRFNTEAY